jgi:hypothetical protein
MAQLAAQDPSFDVSWAFYFPPSCYPTVYGVLGQLWHPVIVVISS